MTSPECQKIIKNSDKVNKEKEAEKAKQQKLIDDYVKKDKEEKKQKKQAIAKTNAAAKKKLMAKKKVPCRGSRRGRPPVNRASTIDNPKI